MTTGIYFAKEGKSFEGDNSVKIAGFDEKIKKSISKKKTTLTELKDANISISAYNLAVEIFHYINSIVTPEDLSKLGEVFWNFTYSSDDGGVLLYSRDFISESTNRGFSHEARYTNSKGKPRLELSFNTIGKVGLKFQKLKTETSEEEDTIKYGKKFKELLELLDYKSFAKLGGLEKLGFSGNCYYYVFHNDDGSFFKDIKSIDIPQNKVKSAKKDESAQPKVVEDKKEKHSGLPLGVSFKDNYIDSIPFSIVMPDKKTHVSPETMEKEGYYFQVVVPYKRLLVRLVNYLVKLSNLDRRVFSGVQFNIKVTKHTVTLLTKINNTNVEVKYGVLDGKDEVKLIVNNKEIQDDFSSIRSDFREIVHHSDKNIVNLSKLVYLKKSTLLYSN